MTTKPRPHPVQAAGVYCRISLDKAGEGLGIARQREMCEKLAADKGWPVAEVYDADNDRSAYNGKRRPDYERMLADIKAGRIDAVICVDLDRLTRRPIELEAFMDLADRHGVALANVSGDTDLSSPDGRLRARIMGSVARHESEKKAERQRREGEQAAKRGVPRGSVRPFGYENDRVTVRESEAVELRDAVRRMLAGTSANDIARDWNERGVPTVRGAKYGWGAGTIVKLARNPRYAGLRTYKGEIVAEGKWEPIIDRASHEAMVALLKRRARPGRPSVHLLSGIARCGRCGAPLWVSMRNDRATPIARYCCVKRPGAPGCGRLTAVADPIDADVRDAIIATLASPKFAKAQRARGRGLDKDRDAAVRDLTSAEQRLEELAADYAAGDISRREWVAARDVARDRIAAAERIVNSARGPLADLPSDAAKLRALWDDATLDWKRSLVRAVIASITIKPSTTPGLRDDDRLDVEWVV
jgi:DNA invertase Pin-like site-specific DNA recombinase